MESIQGLRDQRLKKAAIVEGFRTKQPFSLKKRQYEIKTAETRQELAEALKLRFDVFYNEKQGQNFAGGYEHDPFDTEGDLLIIIDHASSKVVGTYRLISSTYTDNFYTATEFQLGEFLATPGTKLEMSRACIHQDYRNGIVIALLWSGIARYAQECGADYLFGCSSIWLDSLKSVPQIYSHLEASGRVTDQYQIRAKEDYKVPRFSLDHDMDPSFDPAAHIPPLLRVYFKAGAKIHGEPAFDAVFNCVDFLTIINFNAMSPSFSRKYTQ